MGDTTEPKPAPALARIAALLAPAMLAIAVGGGAGAAGASTVGELESRISGAREQAQSLGAEIDRATQALAGAQRQALAAAQREAQLNAILEQGLERERALEGQVADTRDRLAAARAQLRRGLNVLSARLVAIYRSGMPDSATLLLDAEGWDDLQTRAEYLSRIQDADASLVARVRTLRDRVSEALVAVEDAEQRAEQANAEIAAARDQIAAVRAGAEAQAARLAALRDQRQAAIDGLQSRIGAWTDRVQRLERISARQARTEVSEWFGDWAIPESIVMCESGGNFEAVNPTSGAGGAYQILPSTWDLYGGEGDPEDASAAEQSQIAAQIWADSGAAAWECAG